VQLPPHNRFAGLQGPALRVEGLAHRAAF
jgi:hypothetical protein